jgi:hypothetical protein
MQCAIFSDPDFNKMTTAINSFLNKPVQRPSKSDAPPNVKFVCQSDFTVQATPITGTPTLPVLHYLTITVFWE